MSAFLIPLWLGCLLCIAAIPMAMNDVAGWWAFTVFGLVLNLTALIFILREPRT